MVLFMARAGKNFASEGESSKLRREMPLSAVRIYRDILSEVESIANSSDMHVQEFRNHAILGLNHALTFCCDISGKDNFGRVSELDFWKNLNKYLELKPNVRDSFVEGLVRDMSSGISLKLSNDTRYAGMYRRLGIEQPGVKVSPALNGESYFGAADYSKSSHPMLGGLSQLEVYAVENQFISDQ